ncbi:deoxyhypusine synthase [candidate division KSB1 bacterium]
MSKQDLLKEKIKHIDIKKINAVPIIEGFGSMAFQARNLSRASKIYNKMLEDKDCSVILCLAGSLFSAGLKTVAYDMIMNNMVDVIVSTGAVIVDQDFFEGLGFSHYMGTPFVNDEGLRELHIDRIYDTYIDEDELRECDMTIAEIAESLEKRPFSSREFIKEMGKYLDKNARNRESVVLAAYKKDVPVFVPAFSDCSAGFGLIHHQAKNPEKHLTIDSVRDFRELTEIKIKANETGILMIGGGVPKNFTQDVVVAAEILEKDAPMHKYAVQITVADERDGALSGSTLKEATSWGKVDIGYEQMVFSEATIALPLLASYAYHKGAWKDRESKRWNSIF